MIKPFFITGYLRSGTTLLEKFWHNHPQVVVASQPFPFLFYAVKEAFYHQIGVTVPQYPLGDLFDDNTYSREQFLAFARQHRLTEGAVNAVMTRMKGYSGQMMPALLDLPPIGGSLIDIFSHYAQQYPHMLGRHTALYAGSKEVFCEEFIPCFLQAGIPVFLIIRDPRSVVASIHGGSGSMYASRTLSVLQIARSWRKSVAYAIAHLDNPLFHLLRYEQLGHDAVAVLQPLARALKLDLFPDSVIAGELYSQDGSKWFGNSSFEQSTHMASGYEGVLDRQTVAFLDAVCGPEMAWLDMAATPADPERSINAFRDPFQPGCPQLSEHEVHAELARLQKLADGTYASLDRAEEEIWFLLQNVQGTLSHAVQGEQKYHE